MAKIVAYRETGAGLAQAGKGTTLGGRVYGGDLSLHGVSAKDSLKATRNAPSPSPKALERMETWLREAQEAP